MEGIKLEAGKFYRTRDGRKAFVGGINLNPFGVTENDYVARGYIDEGKNVERSWTADGHWFKGDEDNQDLVAEWVEPKRIKGWVNIYLRNPENPQSAQRGRLSCVWPTRKDADEFVVDGRIACIEIDVLEGQGLDGSAR